ncbi:MAG: family N-acetyltransferase [Bacillales bacterium]|nr:family N-acetyltransferase [Bacillales bacterium]
MKPILLDFPERIEGERVYIRPCLPGDGKAVYEALIRSLDELKPWLPWAHSEQSLEDAEERVRQAYAKYILREDMRLHYFRKSDDVFLGSGGYPRFNWDTRCFEIGYWIDTLFIGQGYATETAKLLEDFAFNFLHANRVEIRVDTRNRASRNIPEKLGFQLEGILRHDGFSADSRILRDTCVYAKIRE